MVELPKKLHCFTIVIIVLLSALFLKTESVAAKNLTAPTHSISLEFELQSNSLQASSRIDLPAGLSLYLDYSHLNVSRIHINGQQRDTDAADNYLEIPSSPEGQEILITYSKEIGPDSSPYNLISQAGITLVDSWYPVANTEMFFELTARIPLHFEAVSEAEEITTIELQDSKEVTFRFPHPLFSLNFVAGPYVVSRESFGSGKTLAAYFFPEDVELAANYLVKAKHYLELYEDMLGPYPYESFAIVENRLPSGFAMPTFTLLGQSVVRLPFIVDTSLGHEVLHAWFGNGVRISPAEGNWVEGLTTYLADHTFAADKGRDKTFRKAQLVKYQSYVRPEMDLHLRDFRNIGHSDSRSKPLRSVGYNKSSMFFHMLRRHLGDEIFFTALRDFYTQSKFKAAGWTDLQTSFENVSGLDIEDFFSQWLDREDIPVLRVIDPEIIHKNGYPLLQFSIVQENATSYILKVPAVIKTATEEIHKKLLLSQSESFFEIPLTSVPHSLVIDPGYDLVRELAPAELPPTWSRFLGAENILAILPSAEHETHYAAILQQLEHLEGKILLQDDVSDKDLAENSLLFLGTEGGLSRSLFARPDHAPDGFTLDVRNNPLNPAQVAVLMTGSDREQVEKSANKLRHYGKYSYLSFKDGRIQQKDIAETNFGITVDLFRLPAGIEADRAKTFEDIIAKLLHYQVIYIGEGHTNYEDHLLQLEIIRALHQHDPRLAIGMEMFTRQSQPVLDRYIAGELDEKSFLRESHYYTTWRYDYRLYRDIINFARYNTLAVVGLNLEKDIVSLVFKGGGPGSLDEEDAANLPVDRKLDEPGYLERIETAFIMHADQKQNGNFNGFLQAQALWDETMAETIAGYLTNHPDKRMVIIAGQGHVDRINAIPPRVGRRLPVSQSVVINSSGSAADSQIADFIFFSPPASLPPFPLLGVVLEDTDDEEGVLVAKLSSTGQAKDAGIKEEDIILAIDSAPVNDVEDIKIEMLYKEKSESVNVRIRRKAFLAGAKELEITIPLKRPKKRHHM
ncbi:MAG: ChaN family lipoprotein [Desulfobulbales bacterium]|nr:ChaN family lipoprotein [Desulfobulbales bacterium]